MSCEQEEREALLFAVGYFRGKLQDIPKWSEINTELTEHWIAVLERMAMERGWGEGVPRG